MASAFTDQLRIDREAFENEFRDAIAKGRLSSNDRLALEAEAERLHLSMEDVDRITDKVKSELMRDTGALPDDMAPEIVLEKYRQQISHLKIFSLSKQAEHVDLMLLEAGNVTDLERQIWLLMRHPSR